MSTRTVVSLTLEEYMLLKECLVRSYIAIKDSHAEYPNDSNLAYMDRILDLMRWAEQNLIDPPPTN